MIAVCAAEDLRVPEDLRADRGTLSYAARRITASRSFTGVMPPGSSETLRFSAVRTRSLRDHEPGRGTAGPGRAGARAEPEPGRGTGRRHAAATAGLASPAPRTQPHSARAAPMRPRCPGRPAPDDSNVPTLLLGRRDRATSATPAAPRGPAHPARTQPAPSPRIPALVRRAMARRRPTTAGSARSPAPAA